MTSLANSNRFCFWLNRLALSNMIKLFSLLFLLLFSQDEAAPNQLARALSNAARSQVKNPHLHQKRRTSFLNMRSFLNSQQVARFSSQSNKPPPSTAIRAATNSGSNGGGSGTRRSVLLFAKFHHIWTVAIVLLCLIWSFWCLLDVAGSRGARGCWWCHAPCE